MNNEDLEPIAFSNQTSIQEIAHFRNRLVNDKFENMNSNQQQKCQSFNAFEIGTPKVRKQKKTKTNIILRNEESVFGLRFDNDNLSKKDISSVKYTFGARSEKPKRESTNKIVQQINEKVQKQKYKFAQEKMKCRTEKTFNNSDNQFYKMNKRYEKTKLKTEQIYLVDLYKIYGYQRLKYELNIYQDNYSFLKLRKFIIKVIYGILIILNYMQRTIFYKLFMSIIILVNLVIFVSKILSIEDDKFIIYEISNAILLKLVVIYVYIADQVFRILSKGIIGHKHAYFRVVKNWFDLILTVLQIITTLIPIIDVVDFSPLRLITLLLYLGDFVPGLKIMLQALGKSFKYLVEALIIVIIFGLFFATLGQSLFHGLINYRCLPKQYDSLDDQPWISCRITSCPDDLVCQYVSQGPNIPTSFNNVFSSYAQVLRTITMDDWTWVMYFTLKSYGTYIWVYYLLIIFFGGFFGFNLVIAVLKIHYSQQTNQKLNQSEEDDQHQKEEKLNLQILKQNGLYHPILQYKMYLKGDHQLLSRSFCSFTSIQSEQPRILSGKHYSKYENNFQFLQQFSLKTLLLPKFVDIKKYQNLLQDLYDNLSEKPDINMQCLTHNEFTRYWANAKNEVYVSNSASDVIQCKQEVSQKVQNRILQFRYQTKSKNKQKNLNELKQFPILKSRRLKEKIASFASSGITLMDIHHHQSRATSQQQTASIHPNNIIISAQNKKSTSTFILHKEKEIYVKIYGFYHNYKAVSELINKKIQIRIADEIKNYEEKYLQIRMPEMQTGIIESKNCSISSVINNYEHKNIIKHSLNHIDYLIWLIGIRGKIKIIRKITFMIITNKFTNFFVDCVILVNFLCLSLIGIISNQFLTVIEDFTTIIVSIEFALKLISYQTSKLVQKEQVILESIIILINFYEMSFRQILNQQDIIARLLRGTKILLFHRCLKYIRMAVLIGLIAKRTFKQYIYLTFLMFLMILIYGLLGMAVYASSFDETQLLGHLHSYKDPLKSWMTVFNIMTNDDWYGVLALGTKVNQIFAFIYSFSMIHFLNYITYGLVMAILLDGFGEYLIEIKKDQDIMFKGETSDKQDSDSEAEENQKEKEKGSATKSLKVLSQNQSVQKDTQYGYLLESICKILIYLYRITSETDKNQEEKDLLRNQVQRIRIFCVKTIRSELFYWSRLGLNIGFIVLIAIQTYHVEYMVFVDSLILITNLLITVQTMMLIIALGLFHEKGSYIQHIWQIIDIMYLVCYYLQLINTESRILHLFLYLRYLRPFKLLYSFTPIVKLYNSLVAALYNMSNVLITLLIIWTMFAVYGMILYQNKFGFCDDLMQFDINKQQCEDEGRRWITYQHNFDNITVALPTLFVISTFDGWGEILQVAENSRPSYQGPSPFANQLPTYIYLTLFCFIGSMFFLSLFTGLLFLNLKASQQKIEYDDLTVYQQEFIQVSQKILRDSPSFSQPPRNIIRRIAQKLNSNSYFQYLSFLILIPDTIIQMSFYQDMEIEIALELNKYHEIISILFTFWVIVQLLDYGFKRFIDDQWRQFYSFIVIISLFELIATQKYDLFRIQFTSTMFTENYQIIRLLFALRNLRILILFKGFDDLQRLIRVMIFSFPFLGKILFILIVTTLSYALLGCQLFGHIDKGVIIDSQINFSTFTSSLLTLLKCGSCDNFRSIMTDTMIHNIYCYDDPRYCGSQFAQIYFISFVFISNYVLLNLFVLGLIEQFEKFFQSENSILQVYIESIDKIKTVWCKYSYQRHGKAIHYLQICKFLLEIGQPFTHVKDNIWDAARFAGYLKIRTDDQGYIQFNSLIYEIFRRTFKQQVFKQGSEDSIKIIKKFNKEMQMRLFYFRRDKLQKRSFIATYVEFNSNFSIASDYLSILVIFKAWQNYTKQLIRRSKLEQEDFSDNSSFGQEILTYSQEQMKMRNKARKI
ncbi:unnamed protein product (macronuclear) [Paramecium tetraurelia]|uniref:Ion transport domain-containing protein n=1 Tax=Paramecium tetraurelia TaxID=5888 RepID=A0C5N7_PARTE|nr:uncharacterized protein GSPATT00035233001 [Paramecium tetraurelia]CAK66104.1 unnamed protein product [Paramecium tetraurelia]|eukprot:XP_001433501.1 hypothetical protein (macronuclear) [Paramecium tetraurelia strain d4-2]